MNEKLLRSQLNDYLIGKMTLRKFCQWFFPLSWDVESPPNLLKLVYAIKLALAEYSGGYASQSILRKRLAKL